MARICFYVYISLELFDYSGESTVLNHLNFYRTVLCNFLLHFVVVHCLTVGVNTIFVACEFVLLVAEEVKFYIESITTGSNQLAFRRVIC